MSAGENLSATDSISRWGRFATFQLKLWRHCWRLLRKNRAGQQAAALSYHTIFGIVPLAIIMLVVFHSFPAYREIGNRAKKFIYEQLMLDFEYNVDQVHPDEPAQEQAVTPADKIEEVAQTFITRYNKGSIAFFSGLFVVWAGLGLFNTIERAFNNIYHVVTGRNFLFRIVSYWALLTLGPLLLGVGIYFSTRWMTVEQHALFIPYVQPLVSYLVSLFGLFCLYFFLPNTRVKFSAAIWGAAVAALIWSIMKFAFGVYIMKVIPFGKIYGVMGLIPLSVLWIYVTWWIALFGLQLTFATQNLKKLDEEELATMQNGNEFFLLGEFGAIAVLQYIFSQFHAKGGPVTAAQVCSRFSLPAEFGEKLLRHFIHHGLLLRTAEPQQGYAPATDAANIPLTKIISTTREADFGCGELDKAGKLCEITRHCHETLEKHTLADILTAQKSEA